MLRLHDILVASKDEEEYKKHLRILFKRLEDNGIILSPIKYIFGANKVLFLDYEVSKKGTQLSLEKIEAIKRFPRSENLQQLRQFLDTLNFYRRFIPDKGR